MSGLLHLFYRITRLALDGLHINLVEFLHEEVTVFRIDNGLNRSTQYLDAIFFQYSFLVEFHTTVQRRLSTKRQQDTIRTLLFDDAFYKLRSNRLEIHSISNILTGLHRSDIRIDKYRVDTLFLQRLQRLCTAIVELTGLTNLQRS